MLNDTQRQKNWLHQCHDFTHHHPRTLLYDLFIVRVQFYEISGSNIKTLKYYINFISNIHLLALYQRKLKVNDLPYPTRTVKLSISIT